MVLTNPQNSSLLIQIAQLNTQRKKSVITQLLNNYGKDFNIFLIQEPNWGLIGRDPTDGKEVYGPVALQGWKIILPIPAKAGLKRRPRTLTYYKPRNNFTLTLRSDIIEHRDIQVFDILQGPHPPVRIINVYNNTPKGQECILNRLRYTEGIFTLHPTLLTGDFNLHHPLWSRDDQEAQQDQLTEDIVDWTTLQGLSLLNPKGEITHLARCDGERPSVIDLSFANQEATDNDTFKDWAIDTRLALDSDHNAIKFTIDQLSQEIENPLDNKFNLRNIKAEDWIKVMEEELEAHREPLDAL